MSRFGGRTLAAALCALAALLLVRAPPPVAAEPWQPCGEGLPFFVPALTLGAAPDQPGTLWAGTNGRPGLWRARGEEGSWQPVPDSPPTYTFLWDAGRQTWWAGTAEGL